MSDFGPKKQTHLVRTVAENVPDVVAKRDYLDLTESKLKSYDLRSMLLVASAIAVFFAMGVIFPGTLGTVIGTISLLFLMGWGATRLVLLPLGAFNRAIGKWSVQRSIEDGKNPNLIIPANSVQMRAEALKNVNRKTLTRLVLRQPVAVELPSISTASIRWEDSGKNCWYHQERRRANPYTSSEKRQWAGYERDLQQKWEAENLANATTKRNVIIARGAKIGVVSWTEDSVTKCWLDSVDNALSL